MWITNDGAVVRGSLARLATEHDEAGC